jgi:DNA mismatch repair protein MutS
MKVKEWEGEVIFLHEVGAGSADRSYGIQVAKLAGLPAVVVERATQVLHNLEQGGEEGQGGAQGQKMTALSDELPLFSAIQEKINLPLSEPSLLDQEMNNINPDELSPRDALELIYKLKGLLP